LTRVPMAHLMCEKIGQETKTPRSPGIPDHSHDSYRAPLTDSTVEFALDLRNNLEGF